MLLIRIALILLKSKVSSVEKKIIRVYKLLQILKHD
jgi:hypothetical protein